MAKHALIIAAAGSHNLRMLGSPGSGKTMYIPRQRTVGPAHLSGRPSFSGIPTSGRCWLPIAAGQASGAGTDLVERHRWRIERRAYRLFERGVPGDSLEHWRLTQAEVLKAVLVEHESAA